MAKFVVHATWDDCGHLSEEAKQSLWESIPEYQRDARSKGIPQLGSGAIFPIDEQFIIVPDRKIPDHWPRCFGLDVGWNRTAAIWLAKDLDTGITYAYSEHYMGKEEPAIHAHAIRARGATIPGVIDPASRGRSQIDGRTLIQAYIDLGLDLESALSAVEAGLFIVWQLFSTGQLKLFESLANLRQEIRLYRRDADGKVVKANDHACDALRYGIVSGRDRMRTIVPVPDPNREFNTHDGGGYDGSWMG